MMSRREHLAGTAWAETVDDVWFGILVIAILGALAIILTPRSRSRW
jgi:hypothetical protein